MMLTKRMVTVVAISLVAGWAGASFAADPAATRLVTFTNEVTDAMAGYKFAGITYTPEMKLFLGIVGKDARGVQLGRGATASLEVSDTDQVFVDWQANYRVPLMAGYLVRKRTKWQLNPAANVVTIKFSLNDEDGPWDPALNRRRHPRVLLGDGAQYVDSDVVYRRVNIPAWGLAILRPAFGEQKFGEIFTNIGPDDMA